MSSVQHIGSGFAPLVTKSLVLTALAAAACDRSPSARSEDSTPRRSVSTQSDAPSSSIDPPEPPPSSSAPTVRNGWFLARMKDGLPKHSCKADQWFRACFRVDRATCEEAMGREVDACIEKLAATLPVVTDAKSGGDAGEVIGQCAGSAYEIKRAADRIHTPACDDVLRWLREHPQR